jgi:hypothetical protein
VATLIETTNYPQLLFVGQVDLIGPNLFRSQQRW